MLQKPTMYPGGDRGKKQTNHRSPKTFHENLGGRPRKDKLGKHLVTFCIVHCKLNVRRNVLGVYPKKAWGKSGGNRSCIKRPQKRYGEVTRTDAVLTKICWGVPSPKKQKIRRNVRAFNMFGEICCC